MTSLRKSLGLPLLAISAAGCSPCSGTTSGGSASGPTSSAPGSAAPAVVTLPPRVMPPPSPAWQIVRGAPGVAAPQGCAPRGPILRSEVPERLLFTVDPRTLGTLVAAISAGDPLALLQSGTIPPALPNEEAAAPRPPTPGEWIPWPDPGRRPLVARTPSATGDTWIVAWDAKKANGSEVIVARGNAAQTLGLGDGFSLMDLTCDAGGCAALATRRARVARSGASAFFWTNDAGSAIAPAEIEPDPEADGDARPFGWAALGPAKTPRIAILTNQEGAQLWEVAPGAPARVAERIPAPHGLVDAAWNDGRPWAIAHGNDVDNRGCAGEGAAPNGARVWLERPGKPHVEVIVPGPPQDPAIRPIGRSALALWRSPLGCEAQRVVLYGWILGEDGSPVGDPIPIADATSYAAATSGDDVDVWLRQGGTLTWARWTCGKSEKP